MLIALLLIHLSGENHIEAMIKSEEIILSKIIYQ